MQFSTLTMNAAFKRFSPSQQNTLTEFEVKSWKASHYSRHG